MDLIAAMTTAEKIITLAQNIESLSQEQRRLITELASTLSGPELEQLAEQLETVLSAEHEALQKKVEVYKNALAKGKQLLVADAREKRESAEAGERTAEEVANEDLLKTLQK